MGTWGGGGSGGKVGRWGGGEVGPVMSKANLVGSKVSWLLVCVCVIVAGSAW